jgi:hypothetical protein
MADIKATSLGGVPKGTTANRPTSPAVGDVYYNGTLGCLEIYTSQGWVANSAPPGIPTIGTTTYSASGKEYNNSSASVAFTPGEGGGLPNSYRATSTPGGFTGTSSSSPIIVSGLQSATAYTFSVTGTNNFGTSAGSINSNSITANTIPQSPGTPTAAYASSTSVTLTFTAGATGGSTITNYKYSIDGTTYTAFSPAQTSSPLTVTGLTPSTNYTFYIKAVNANGDSLPSSISNSVLTGAIVSGGTLSSDATYYYRAFTGTSNLIISNASISLDVLTVAGGGAGGRYGGGGGAGGIVYHASQSLSPGTTSITVGGGATSYFGDAQSGGQAPSGNPSQFGSLQQAYGGGGGGLYQNNSGTSSSGANGGSGGGGAVTNGSNGSRNAGSSTQVGVGATAYYGNNGGAGVVGTSTGAAGGGGAGGAGVNAGTGAGGAGGIGISIYSSWGLATSTGHNVSGTVYYGGGGGGAATGGGALSLGGSGGGGKGASTDGGGATTTVIDGLASTGGGGGGNPDQYVSGVWRTGAGGSGVVVVRYLRSAVGG